MRRNQQYKLHWDAELTPFNLVTEIVRYVTGLLYLAEPDVGGETLLPLADGGMAKHGCEGCERKAGLASERTQACYKCIDPQQDTMLQDCADPAHGVSVAPKAGRLALWYNYRADGSWEPGALHAGCPVLVGTKLAANIWLDRRDGVPMHTNTNWLDDEDEEEEEADDEF